MPRHSLQNVVITFVIFRELFVVRDFSFRQLHHEREPEMQILFFPLFYVWKFVRYDVILAISFSFLFLILFLAVGVAVSLKMKINLISNEEWHVV